MGIVKQFLNPTMMRYGHCYDHDELIKIMRAQMTDYRLIFPLLICDNTIVLMIALMTYANDPRMLSMLKCRQQTFNNDADILFMCHGYLSENEWRCKAKNIIKVFPEQIDFAGIIITMK